MKADPEAQRRLLDVQAIDTALWQLAHRRRNLPEHVELERLDSELRTLGDERVRAQVAVDDLDRDISRLERDIDQVRQRAARDRSRLDAGSSSVKELEGLEHELASLTRRQTELEDAELELMEQREEAQRALSDVQERLSTAHDAHREASERCDAALAEIAGEEQRRTAERAPIVDELPADLVALYDKVRDQQGGVGAAIVRSRRCEGCRLELSGGDVARVRQAAPDDVVRCEECRRIMVRTSESGL